MPPPQMALVIDNYYYSCVGVIFIGLERPSTRTEDPTRATSKRINAGGGVSTASLTDLSTRANGLTT